MNKDKIIKDLKERNDKLKRQYEYERIRVCHLEYENERLKIKLNSHKRIKDKIKEWILNEQLNGKNLEPYISTDELDYILELLEATDD